MSLRVGKTFIVGCGSFNSHSLDFQEFLVVKFQECVSFKYFWKSVLPSFPWTWQESVNSMTDYEHFVNI